MGGLLLVCAVALVPATDAAAKKCTQKGTGGVDILKGTKKKDVLCGKRGDDVLLGKGGNDVLKGGDGDDVLNGKGGKDSLSGGGGDDQVVGGAGDDKLKGQGGADTAAFADSKGAVTVDLVAGAASGEEADTLVDVESVVGSPGDDVLKGNASVNQLVGGEGADLISGGDANDELEGQAGNDRIFGDANDDLLKGGPGDDELDGGDGVNECDGGPGTNKLADNCDPAAPQLASLSASPGSVDTQSDARTINFTITATDAGKGVDAAGSTIRVADPAGQPKGQARLRLVSGDPNSGSFEANIVLPQYSAQGIWAVSLDLADQASRHAEWSSSQLVAAGHAGTFAQTGIGDADAPQVTAFSISPDPIDTSASAQTVAFVVTATDAVAGVDPAASKIEVYGPDAKKRGETTLPLSSGDVHSGTFSGSVQLPQFSPQGIYDVRLVLADDAGNQADLDRADLVAASLPGSFLQAGAGDDTAPSLVDFDLTPTYVALGTDRRVTFSVHATDAMAGVDQSASRIIVRDPVGAIEASLPFQPAGLADHYTATFEVPVAVTGDWTVDVRLVDAVLNEVTKTSSQLIGLTFPGGFFSEGNGAT